jgi:predicted RNase H-like nuclease
MHTKRVQKIRKTHFRFHIFLKKKLYRLLDNVAKTVKPGRLQTTIWCMHNACYLSLQSHIQNT